MDNTAFFKMNYGLYIATTTYEGKNYGCVLNTMAQVTAVPPRISVTLNKENATTQAILSSGIFSGVVLSEETPMDVIGTFGFMSSLTTDKFAQCAVDTDKNGVPYPTEKMSAQFSCRVESSLDIGTHIIIVGMVEDAQVVSSLPPMTYAYYHKVKNGKTPPKASSFQANPEKEDDAPAEGKITGYTCSVCGFVHQGEELPDDFICPICQQDATVFTPNKAAAKAPDSNALPKNQGYECTICGYIHPENELPDDFICPICKQGASVFAKRT